MYASTSWWRYSEQNLRNEVQYEDDKKFIDRPVMFRLFLFFYLFPLRLSHELLTRNVKKWEIESFKLLSKMSNALKNMLKDGS